AHFDLRRGDCWRWAAWRARWIRRIRSGVSFIAVVVGIAVSIDTDALGLSGRYARVGEILPGCRRQGAQRGVGHGWLGNAVAAEPGGRFVPASLLASDGALDDQITVGGRLGVQQVEASGDGCRVAVAEGDLLPDD